MGSDMLPPPRSERRFGDDLRRYGLLEHSPKLQSTRKLTLLRVPNCQLLTLFEGYHYPYALVSAAQAANACKYQGQISLLNCMQRFVNPYDRSERCLYVSKRSGSALVWDQSPPWLSNGNPVWNLKARTGLREPRKPAPHPGSRLAVRPPELGSMAWFQDGTNRSTP